MKKRVTVVAGVLGLLLPLGAAPAHADPVDDILDAIADAGCSTVYIGALIASAPGNPQVYRDPQTGDLVVRVDPGDPDAMQQASEDYADCVS